MGKKVSSLPPIWSHSVPLVICSPSKQELQSRAAVKEALRGLVLVRDKEAENVLSSNWWVNLWIRRGWWVWLIDPELRFGRRGLERRWHDRYIIKAAAALLLFSLLLLYTLWGFNLRRLWVIIKMVRRSEKTLLLVWSLSHPLIVTFRTPWLEIIQHIGIYFQSPVVPNHIFTQLMSTLVICFVFGSFRWNIYFQSKRPPIQSHLFSHYLRTNCRRWKINGLYKGWFFSLVPP